MTKLLYIPTSEFLPFLSSIKYDRETTLEEELYIDSEQVIEYEDSFSFENENCSLEEYIEKLIKEPRSYKSDKITGAVLFREELEIIYG